MLKQRCYAVTLRQRIKMSEQLVISLIEWQMFLNKFLLSDKATTWDQKFADKNIL